MCASQQFLRRCAIVSGLLLFVTPALAVILNPNNNAWELAGINLAVDGPFSTSSSGTNPFDAAMFTTGLFAQDDQGNWVTAPNPSAFYSTEIAAHKGYIESVVMHLVSVVSRKTHGSAGTFTVNFPLPPNSSPRGVECRSSSSLGTGNYSIVLSFVNNLTSVAGATVSGHNPANGTGTVTSTLLGPGANQCTVDLTNVSTGQYLTITLNNVTDMAGNAVM
jgi:hypothetical protein